MSTQDIKICLGVSDLETFDATIQDAVRERLEIELLVRQMGLRHPTPADVQLGLEVEVRVGDRWVEVLECGSPPVASEIRIGFWHLSKAGVPSI